MFIAKSSRFLAKVCCVFLTFGSTSAFVPRSSLSKLSSPLATTSTLCVSLPFDDGTTRNDPVPSKIDPGSLRQKHPKNHRLPPEDDWIANLDYGAFGDEVTALGKELRASSGDADAEHLFKLMGWRNLAAAVGLATVWTTPNPITVLALSTWTYASWTMIAHHTCHGGYNRVDAAGTRFKSRRFAQGLVNRCLDWLDWMQPEAWNVEHNRLHHYNLNEAKDPDLVQRNFDAIRNNKELPMAARYLVVVAAIPIWKWWYYAPNTYKELRINEWLKTTRGEEKGVLPAGFNRDEPVSVSGVLNPFSAKSTAVRKIVPVDKLFVDVLGPMLVGRYLLIPALFWCLVPGGAGVALAGNAFWNLLASELLTNAHAFLTIVTNHAGEDLYTFEGAVKPNTGSFYVRQIVGSTNYPTGSDPVDFSHGFLNYQIEHHVWPDLSMLQYQRGAPRLKAICEKHGVPYVQENIIERFLKTVDIMVGKTTMRVFPTDAYEPASDRIGGGQTTYWESTEGALEEE